MGAGQSFSSNNKRRDDQRFTDVGKEPDRLLPPLPPIIQLHSSTSSLHEAIKPIQHLVEDLPNRVTYSLERCKNPKDGLTNDESAAIFLYTLEWPLGKTSFYTVFNRVLRDGNRAKLVPFHQYLNLIMSAFNKLPSIQDRVWRGETGDLSTQYQLGTIHVWWGVSSCADMVHVTDNFRDQIKKLTLFNVKCINGKIIKNHSEFSDENETVLPPGTYLKVKSSLNATANLCIVHLEQIVPTSEEMAQLMSVADTLNKISGTQQVDNIYVLWLDPTVNQSEENKRTQEKLKQLFHNRFKPFQQLEEAVHYIQDQKTQHFLLITGGLIGRQIVPKISNLLQVQFVVVYCRDKQANEQWSKDYEKVKAIVVQAEEMVKTVQQLHKDLTEEQESVLSKNSKCSNLRSAGIANEPQEVLSAIDGFEDQPLLSLEESLRELIHIIPELKKYIYITMLNCKNPADGLTQNESAAIQIYTMYWEPSENCLSHLLNKDFRSGSRNVLRKWFPYLKLFLYALNKLPSYKGTVWRSVKIDLSDRFEAGQTRAWRSFVATTPDISILESSGYLGEHGPRTLFSIECENGKCIKKHLYCPTGDEVLLLPGFCFEVKYNLNVGSGLHIIGLKEILPTSEETATATISVSYMGTQQVDNVYVLWFDPTVNKSEENKRTQEKLKQLFHNRFKPFQQLEEAVHYIQEQKTQHFLLITGGLIGRQIVPKINNLLQVQFVVVYCRDKQANEQWSKDYEKVKAVVVKADEMIFVLLLAVDHLFSL